MTQDDAVVVVTAFVDEVIFLLEAFPPMICVCGIDIIQKRN
jgi:hypothetical protein